MDKRVFAIALCAAAGSCAFAQPAFTPLGRVDRFPSSNSVSPKSSVDLSRASGVSADGSVVVGISRDNFGQLGVFRWTPSGGMDPLPIPAGATFAFTTIPLPRISADGQTVGGALVLGGSRVYAWTPGAGYVYMPPGIDGLPGPVGVLPYAISADGSTIVGAANIGTPTNFKANPFRWRLADGVGHLLPAAKAVNIAGCSATACNADGSAVFGTVAVNPSGPDPNPHQYMLAWTNFAAGAPAALTSTTSTGVNWDVRATSASGDVWLASRYQNAAPTAAVMWTPDVPERTIIAGADAQDMSADGLVVVATRSSDRAPLVWTPRAGALPLTQVLASQGTDLLGYTPVAVHSVSADGRWVVGAASSPGGLVEGFRAELTSCAADVDADGTTDLQDFMAFFNCWDQSQPCADTNGDGTITLTDFFLFFAHWDQGC